MAVDTLQFVDSIAASPTLRLDVNDDTNWGLTFEGSDFSPPGLRRSVTSSMLMDGDTYPASAYGNRAVRMRLELLASTVDNAATEIQKLARELDRPTNIVKWQAGTTNPVFFRTFRSPMGRITEVPGTGRFRTFDVEVMAEPFALGLPVTLSSWSMGGDPMATPAGIFADVAGILGDVETPLRLTINPKLTTGHNVLFASRRRGNPATPPFVEKPVNWTAGTNATLTGAVMRVTWGTPTLATRATFCKAGTVDADIRGRYRVFVRLHTSGSTVTSWAFRRSTGGASTNVQSIGLNEELLDLGYVYFPDALDPIVDHTGVAIPAVLPQLILQGQRDSGAQNVDILYILLIPADDQTTIIRPTALDSPGPTIDRHVWDGERHMMWGTNSSAQMVGGEAPGISGSYALCASPGVTNRFYFLADTLNGPEAPGAYTITGTYLPRYLYVRPLST